MSLRFQLSLSPHSTWLSLPLPWNCVPCGSTSWNSHGNVDVPWSQLPSPSFSLGSGAISVSMTPSSTAAAWSLCGPQSLSSGHLHGKTHNHLKFSRSNRLHCLSSRLTWHAVISHPKDEVWDFRNIPTLLPLVPKSPSKLTAGLHPHTLLSNSGCLDFSLGLLQQLLPPQAAPDAVHSLYYRQREPLEWNSDSDSIF